MALILFKESPETFSDLTSEGGLGTTDQGGHHIKTHRGSSTLRAIKKRPRRSNALHFKFVLQCTAGKYVVKFNHNY